ncbi:hypothetical protein [Ignatzschineria cameli]|uniref:Uncharacterized protein n=1 Tax=Ignatzschineria cameli TaxID=2182793 RepID=A0A2U2AJH0_9GAMM|nr:hypothetical protein [Ignatzschineria cameli]PWD82831.1 hypothetical protein DC080_09870 [Ignatzschineria cameli]PWD82875.1 hypothetical protein DC077_10330 [Ignatzschineria cameli]PWD87645.1 hypothetical protein DC079_10465 [Ignatzschineria cameli]PWD88809.1 hypothetical protein DC078_10545 [Ignatzschineria cameli]PWD90224.1 hypothetical protein DC081_07450 [Ignatzschineria cameli]
MQMMEACSDHLRPLINLCFSADKKARGAAGTDYFVLITIARPPIGISDTLLPVIEDRQLPARVFWKNVIVRSGSVQLISKQYYFNIINR